MHTTFMLGALTGPVFPKRRHPRRAACPRERPRASVHMTGASTESPHGRTLSRIAFPTHPPTGRPCPAPAIHRNRNPTPATRRALDRVQHNTHEPHAHQAPRRPSDRVRRKICEPPARDRTTSRTGHPPTVRPCPTQALTARDPSERCESAPGRWLCWCRSHRAHSGVLRLATLAHGRSPSSSHAGCPFACRRGPSIVLTALDCNVALFSGVAALGGGVVTPLLSHVLPVWSSPWLSHVLPIHGSLPFRFLVALPLPLG